MISENRYFEVVLDDRQGKISSCQCVCEPSARGRARPHLPISTTTEPATCQSSNRTFTPATSSCINNWNNTGCLECVDYTQHPLIVRHRNELNPIFANRTSNFVSGCWIDTTDPSPSQQAWCFIPTSVQPCVAC